MPCIMTGEQHQQHHETINTTGSNHITLCVCARACVSGGANIGLLIIKMKDSADLNETHMSCAEHT
jgi:hypothetical protein